MPDERDGETFNGFAENTSIGQRLRKRFDGEELHRAPELLRGPENLGLLDFFRTTALRRRFLSAAPIARKLDFGLETPFPRNEKADRRPVPSSRADFPSATEWKTRNFNTYWAYAGRRVRETKPRVRTAVRPERGCCRQTQRPRAVPTFEQLAELGQRLLHLFRGLAELAFSDRDRVAAQRSRVQAERGQALDGGGHAVQRRPLCRHARLQHSGADFGVSFVSALGDGRGQRRNRAERQKPKPVTAV